MNSSRVITDSPKVRESVKVLPAPTLGESVITGVSVNPLPVLKEGISVSVTTKRLGELCCRVKYKFLLSASNKISVALSCTWCTTVVRLR